MLARIKKIMTDKGYSPSLFADELDIPRSSISHLLAERNKPSLDIVLRILSKFPEVNSEWLLNGIGAIYKSDDSNQPTYTPNPQPTPVTVQEKQIESAPIDSTNIEKSENTLTQKKEDENTPIATSENLFSEQKEITKNTESVTHISENKTRPTTSIGNLFEQKKEDEIPRSEIPSKNNPNNTQIRNELLRVTEEQQIYNTVRESEDPPVYNYREKSETQKISHPPQKTERKIIRVITIYDDGTFEDFKNVN